METKTILHTFGQMYRGRMTQRQGAQEAYTPTSAEKGKKNNEATFYGATCAEAASGKAKQGENTEVCEDTLKAWPRMPRQSG